MIFDKSVGALLPDPATQGGLSDLA